MRCVLNLRNGGTFAGGPLLRIDGVPVSGAARHDGNAWHAVHLGYVTRAVELPSGGIVGAFPDSSTPTWTYLRFWNGSLGTPNGTVIGVADGLVETLKLSPAGDVIAGGSFTSIDGVTIAGLAQWNGVTWSPLIPAFTGSVRDVVFLPDGRVAAAGTLAMAGVFVGNVGIWDGTSWSALAGISHPPTRLAKGPRGDLFACGTFSVTGGAPSACVARWDASTWTDLGAGWSPMVESVRALAALPNGDVLVGGVFWSAGGVLLRNLARWDGTTWHAWGNGPDGAIEDLHASPDGRIAIGGAFVRVDDVTSAAVARVQPSCPAVTTSYGAACNQAGNPTPLQLTIDVPPWGGGALRSVATSLPATALSLGLYGVQPLWGNLGTLVPPIGIPGCLLLVQPDFVVPQLAITNRSTHVVPVPRSPALIGAMLFHQVLSLELGPTGAPVSLGGTIGFVLTIGAMW